MRPRSRKQPLAPIARFKATTLRVDTRFASPMHHRREIRCLAAAHPVAMVSCSCTTPTERIGDVHAHHPRRPSYASVRRLNLPQGNRAHALTICVASGAMTVALERALRSTVSVSAGDQETERRNSIVPFEAANRTPGARVSEIESTSDRVDSGERRSCLASTAVDRSSQGGHA
jgi:hypothetical protein